MLKNIFKILAIFIIGVCGGIFADQILWPYFIERPLFYQYRLQQQPIYLTQKEQVTIQENTALQNAVEKVEKTVVGIKSQTRKGSSYEGSGLILTSDGLAVTLSEIVPRGSNFYLFFDESLSRGKTLAEIQSRDLENNLVLTKIEGDGLPTIGFANLEKIKLGERVFLLGRVETAAVSGREIVNEGIISGLNEDSIQTNINEDASLNGSPLFDIEGNVIGLVTIDKEGKVSAIPISKIKALAGF